MMSTQGDEKHVVTKTERTKKALVQEIFTQKGCCKKRSVKNIIDENLRNVFRTQSNIYDRVINYFRKKDPSQM